MPGTNRGCDFSHRFVSGTVRERQQIFVCALIDKKRCAHWKYRLDFPAIPTLLSKKLFSGIAKPGLVTSETRTKDIFDLDDRNNRKHYGVEPAIFPQKNSDSMDISKGMMHSGGPLWKQAWFDLSFLVLDVTLFYNALCRQLTQGIAESSAR